MKSSVFLVFVLTLTYAEVNIDLLSTLTGLHDDPAYLALPPDLRRVAIELAATAHTGQLIGYIDSVGFSAVLDLIKHLPIDAAHDLENYILKVITEEADRPTEVGNATEIVTTAPPILLDRPKRSPKSYLQHLESSNAYQSLPREYKTVLTSLLSAAKSKTLTQFISRDVTIIPRLLQHMNPGLARRLNAFFMQKLREEGR